MNLAKRLNQLTKEDGRSALEIATEVGISKSYMSQLMSGKQANPSGRILSSLGKVLGVTVDDLLHGEDSKVVQPAQQTVMACCRCGSERRLILVPFKEFGAVHGLLMTCKGCYPVVAKSTVSINYRGAREA